MKIDEREGARRDNFGDEIYERADFQLKVKEQYSKLMEEDWTIINATQSI